MSATETPVCDFGRAAVDFELPGTDGAMHDLRGCAGANGVLVMFICNHCPFVKAIRHKLVRDATALLEHGVGSVAIMSNDPAEYAEDSFDNMKKIARRFQYPFPYLFDESQQTAKDYGAVCTPDFFGYNKDYELQFRGRLDASGATRTGDDSPRELYEAMKRIAETGRGPKNQTPSIGCSIKWRR